MKYLEREIGSIKVIELKRSILLIINGAICSLVIIVNSVFSI
jgi:hypothetical protein